MTKIYFTPRRLWAAGAFATALLVAVPASLLSATATAGAASPMAADGQILARGKYLVEITGCNDCHTAGYAQAAGKIEEKDWLKGDAVGWRGPWGTTYPTNLRLSIPKLTEKQWIKYARTMEPLPPMPWFNVRAMSERDLTAIYRYVNSLGPAGVTAPTRLPPDKQPAQPYFQFPQ